MFSYQLEYICKLPLRERVRAVPVGGEQGGRPHQVGRRVRIGQVGTIVRREILLGKQTPFKPPFKSD
jgi:hypothetical protein